MALHQVQECSEEASSLAREDLQTGTSALRFVPHLSPILGPEVRIAAVLARLVADLPRDTPDKVAAHGRFSLRGPRKRMPTLDRAQRYADVISVQEFLSFRRWLSGQPKMRSALHGTRDTTALARPQSLEWDTRVRPQTWKRHLVLSTLRPETAAFA